MVVDHGTTTKKSSISTRIISGTIGAVVTSIVVTPLEVVKVVTQAAPSTMSIPLNTTTTTRNKTKSNLVSCPKGCGTFILYNGHTDCVLSKSSVPYFSKTTGESLAEGMIHETGKVVSTSAMNNNDRNTLGTVAMLQRIYAQKGLRGIYAGLRPTLIMAAPNTILYYTAYEEIIWQMRQSIQIMPKHHPNHHNNCPMTGTSSSVLERHANWLFPLFAGGSARFISSTVTAPLELMRTRQAAAVGNGGLRDRSHVGIATQRNGSIYHEFRTIIRNEGGIWTLFRGLRPTLWRDVPFSAIYWLLLEQFRTYWDMARISEKKLTALEQTGEAFLNGALAGMIAAAFTTPFDVAKTRQQTSVLATAPTAASMVSIPTSLGSAEIQNGGALVCKHVVSCSSELRGNVASTSSNSGGTFYQLRHIAQTEGVAGLWRGNQARMLKVAPSCAIMLSSYELGKRLLE
jgi:solute carrier family 25, member 39/40